MTTKKKKIVLKGIGALVIYNISIFFSSCSISKEVKYDSESLVSSSVVFTDDNNTTTFNTNIIDNQDYTALSETSNNDDFKYFNDNKDYDSHSVVNISEDNSTVTENKISNEEHSEDIPKKQEQHSSNSTSEVNKNYKYSDYIQRINEICNTKGFDEHAFNLLKATFDALYNNYDNLYMNYKYDGIMTKTNFIENVFFGALHKTEKFIVCNYGDSTKSEYTKRLNGAKGIYIYSEKTLIISANNTIESSDCETVIHEMDHVVTNMNSPIPSIKKIYEDGKAAFYQMATSSNVKTWQSSFLPDSDSPENYYLPKGSGSNSNYLRLSKTFCVLGSLVGFDKVMSLNETQLKSVISKRYGLDTEKFFQSVVDYVENPNDIHALKYIDEFYLKCFEKKVDRANSKEDILSLFSQYTYYKHQFQTQYFDQNLEDITDSKFNFEPIENKLEQKIENYSILTYVSDDRETRRNIFYSILDFKNSKPPICVTNYKLSVDNGIEFINSNSEIIKKISLNDYSKGISK